MVRAESHILASCWARRCSTCVRTAEFARATFRGIERFALDQIIPRAPLLWTGPIIRTDLTPVS